MATKRWTGATDGDFNKAANWSGGIPVAGDIVVFDSGSVNLDTNVDQTAIDLDTVIVTPGYTGQLGSSGTPFTFGAGSDSGSIVLLRPGSACPGIFLSTGATFDWTRCVVWPVATTCPIELTLTGNVIDLHTKSGAIKLVSGTATSLYMTADSGIDTNLALENVNADLTTVYVAGGAYTQSGSSANVGTLYLDRFTATISKGTIDTVYCRATVVGAKVQWDTDDDTDTAFVVLTGGKLDFAQDQRAKTLGSIKVFTGGIVDMGSHGDQITVTSGIKDAAGQDLKSFLAT